MSFLTTLAAHLRGQRRSLRAPNPLKTYLAAEPSFKAAVCASLQLYPRCTASSAELEALEETVPSTISLEREEGALPVVGADSAVEKTGRGVVNDNVPRTLRSRKWNWWSRRTGLVAVKLGMTQMWNKEGFPVAVTVLQVRLSGVCYPDSQLRLPWSKGRRKGGEGGKLGVVWRGRGLWKQ